MTDFIKYDTVREEYRELHPSVFAELDGWRDSIRSFCERVQTTLGVKISYQPFADINLLYDPSIPPDAYILDSTQGVIIRAYSEKAVRSALSTLLKLLRSENGMLQIQGLIIEKRL